MHEPIVKTLKLLLACSLALNSVAVVRAHERSVSSGGKDSLRVSLPISEFHRIFSEELTQFRSRPLADGLEHLIAVAKLSGPQKYNPTPRQFTAEIILMLMSSPNVIQMHESRASQEQLIRMIGPGNYELLVTASHELARTRNHHRLLDKKLLELRERFSLGSGAAKDLDTIQVNLDWFFESHVEGGDPLDISEPVGIPELPIYAERPADKLGRLRKPASLEKGTGSTPVVPIVGTSRSRAPHSEDSANNVIDALRAAADGATSILSDKYDIAILMRTINNEDRFVVLLGETHFKSTKSAGLANNIMKHFDYFATEGFDSSLTWGGPFLKMFRQFTNVHVRYFFPNWTQPSSIGEVWNRLDSSELRESAKKYVQSLSPEMRQKLKNFMATRTENDLLAEVQAGGLKASVGDVFKAMEEALELESSPIARPPPIKKFRLEEGHQPDIKEHIASVLLPFYLPLKFLAPRVFWISLGFSLIWPGHSILELIWNVTGCVYLFLWLYDFWSATLQVRFQHAPWFDTFFPMARGFLEARDRTMAANVDKIMKSRPEINQMLAIVGKGHVAGIKQLLSEKYMFQEVSLANLRLGLHNSIAVDAQETGRRESK